MRLVLLGGTGAGKGTQATLLCERFGLLSIATGSVLREAIEARTELGQQVSAYVDRGELAPDDIMIALMKEQITRPEASGGWLMDGYPRTAFQAEELWILLDRLKQPLDYAIWLEVPTETLVQRALERARADDRPEAIERRINVFQERTLPILEFYSYRKRLLRIDGMQSPEQVHQQIAEKVEP